MSILEDILKNKKEEVEKRKREVPVSSLQIQSRSRKNCFKEALLKKGLSIIAEMKKKSPSAGIFKGSFNPQSRARLYQTNGARAISILTDKKFFGGTNDHLKEVRRCVNLPLLRKDFIIDEYQIHETAAIGANAILLIVRILEKSHLKELMRMAKSHNLDCLVEVHSAFEMETALKVGADIIGIHNRNLDTLEIDLNTSLTLRPLIPHNCLAISESGIRNVDHVKCMVNVGFDAILVGEALMKSNDSGVTLEQLLSR